MDGSQVVRKNPKMVTRVICGETILLPLYRTSKEINCIYTFNKMASRVWELMDGKRTIAEVKKAAGEEFVATGEEVDREMALFLQDLRQIKAIV